MGTITKCFIGSARTSSIGLMRSRALCSMFIVSSFSETHQKPNNHGPNLNASYHKSENRKTRFAIMASRAKELRGLFENWRTTMRHLHKKGDVVNVFQMSVSKGLIFEGRATVLKPVDDPGEERYLVRFHGRDGKPELGEDYERWIDRGGQGDPDAYVRETNKRLNVG